MPAGYYTRFAAWLASEGFTVLTVDYRGVAGSRRGPILAEAATLRDWGERDLTAAAEHLRAACPGLPLLVVGHSFGGQALGLSDALADADGLLTVGAQLGYYGHWPAPARWRMWATWHLLFPAVLGALGYIPAWAGMGEDLPGGVAREWSRWCRSPNYLLDHVKGAAARLRRFSGQLEVWGFTDDAYAPPAAVRAFADAVRPTDRTLRLVDPATVGARELGHFGFFRPAHRDTLWADAADLLTAWSARA